MLKFARQNGCEWGPTVCKAAAEHGNLSTLKWLRQEGCPWDDRTSFSAAKRNHFELLRWARQQQPACPLWGPLRTGLWLCRNELGKNLLVYLSQQRAHVPARVRAQAHVAATEMTHAVLSLKAALPDKTPHEFVLSTVSLAFF